MVKCVVVGWKARENVRHLVEVVFWILRYRIQPEKGKGTQINGKECDCCHTVNSAEESCQKEH